MADDSGRPNGHNFAPGGTVVFNSLEYAVFLPFVMLAYYGLRHRQQNVLLLVASYVFYGAWDWRFLGLLALSTVVDYAAALRLSRSEDPGRRRLLLFASLGTNLAILGTFKYFGFFVSSAEAMLGSVGLAPSTPVLEVVLPVGISFYTFQSMSYTIDVYRRHLCATPSLIDFALYVAYFPQLVAGPIERATRLLPQISAPRTRPDGDAVRSALVLIGLGLVKKVVVADTLAPVVNEAFATSASAGWLTLLIGTYAFALQIYCDFSGYSDIARGSSRLLGIELTRNFAQPYLSRSITEFWRTWHISLSSWLRDYLYVPLGGNRRGPRRTSINLAVVMLLGGLWHGAAWTFVIWGGLHGLYLAAERRRGVRADQDPGVPRTRDLPAVLATFHLVCLAWVFFRAESFGQAGDVLVGLLTLRPGGVALTSAALVLAAGVVVLSVDFAQRRSGRHAPVLGWPALARGATYGVGTVALLVFSGGATAPFIYFQF